MTRYRRRFRHYPTILMVEWLEKNRVRLFFATGKISEVRLPVRSAKHARIVFGGVGLDPGNGYELSAVTLHEMPGKVWARSRGSL